VRGTEATSPTKYWPQLGSRPIRLFIRALSQKDFLATGDSGDSPESEAFQIQELELAKADVRAQEALGSG
jgi:hypothetical protein